MNLFPIFHLGLYFGSANLCSSWSYVTFYHICGFAPLPQWYLTNFLIASHPFEQLTAAPATSWRLRCYWSIRIPVPDLQSLEIPWMMAWFVLGTSREGSTHARLVWDDMERIEVIDVCDLFRSYSLPTASVCAQSRISGGKHDSAVLTEYFVCCRVTLEDHWHVTTTAHMLCMVWWAGGMAVQSGTGQGSTPGSFTSSTGSRQTWLSCWLDGLSLL